MSVRIEIPGTPVAKERARRGAAGHWYTPKRTREYEESVAWHSIKSAGGMRFATAPLNVRIVLHLRALAGDVDNYAKSILDGLQKGRIIHDDRQVRELFVQFVINPKGEEKAVVELLELDEDCPYCAPDERCALHQTSAAP